MGASALRRSALKRSEREAVCGSARSRGGAKDPWGNQRAGFETEITVNRKDFGLNWNAALEAGGFLVGDEVKINLSIQGVAQA